MRHLDVYYLLRRFIPRRLQVRLRQNIVRRSREKFGHVWPVDETAGTPPQGWQGWPDGKQFAFVLTHDVEGPAGLAKCLKLAELEERAGFRSCFNFIPAARYQVPNALREDLARRGFEVGVHGLLHDGRDFASRRIFNKRCPKMNDALRRWNAVGFRAPSMRSNLEWILDLDIEYDLSTFDTDPFEPVPHGVHTIFPFRMVGRDGKRSYIELPYTLPQDLTLFVMHGETTIETWRRKLAWIAERGGMALGDTHPDYMDFDGTRGIDEYPVERYAEFLDHLKREYAGRYWHALPREVARYCAGRPEALRTGRPKHACMVAYAFYDTDNRIIRYAETLAKRGDQVDVIALRRPGQASQELVRGVRVFRIQERERNERFAVQYLARMLCFLAASTRLLARLHHGSPYHLVHVHSVPDFEVFAAWPAKRRGARVILDIHDIVPEFYVSKFRSGTHSILFKFLVLIERWSTGFADHVIIANHIWQKRLVERSVPQDKCSVVLNYVDTDAFKRRTRQRKDSRFIAVYPGGLQWHQGLDVAIRAFARLKSTLPEAELHIYGDGSERNSLERLVSELGLDDKVFIRPMVPHRDVPRVIAEADIGVVPKRADSFGNEAYSTKILEFMSQGIPVLASRTMVDTYYFSEPVLKFFESGNDADMADKFLQIARDGELRRTMVDVANRHLADNKWAVKQHEYVNLVDSLTAQTGRSRSVTGV